jgi:hypothetical protein
MELHLLLMDDGPLTIIPNSPINSPLSNNATLVTHNTAEFDRVPGQTITDRESPA